VGRFRAVFFEGLGYTQADWIRLQGDLLDLCRSGDALGGQASRFGQKYEVRGTLKGPSGRQAEVVTVWVVLVGDEVPRFARGRGQGVRQRSLREVVPLYICGWELN
jgi:hypothetical protein